jgi:hypothetical protein
MVFMNGFGLQVFSGKETQARPPIMDWQYGACMMPLPPIFSGTSPGSGSRVTTGSERRPMRAAWVLKG